jgi:hypothetical protein
MSIAREKNGARLGLDMSLMDETIGRDTAQSSFTSVTGRLSYTAGKTSYWVEGTEPVKSEGAIERPRTYGAGAAMTIIKGLSVEASHRVIKTDSTTDGVSSVGLRTELPTGTRAWSQYELSNNISGRTSAVLVGIGQKVELTPGFSVDAQYERREGLGKLPETDPLRSLPFAQAEVDRWAAALGVEWAPRSNNARIGLRGELHDNAQSGRGYRVFGAGELSLDKSWALLLRQDSREDRLELATGNDVTRSSQSVFGVAFRPAQRSDWNTLGKLEYRNDRNPMRAAGGILSGTDERLIGALETIWTPSTYTELGLRFAARRSTVTGLYGGIGELTGTSEFGGARIRQNISSRFDLRVAGRMLREQESGLMLYDISPAAGLKLVQGLDLEAGYRFGDLRDNDFARNGGKGFYATLGMSITEQTGKSISDFWRSRLGGGDK